MASMKLELPGDDEFQLNYSLHHGRFVVHGVFVASCKILGVQ